MIEIKRYVGNVESFPVLGKWNFFNHAGVAPLPRVAGDAMRKYAAEAERGAYLGAGWYRDIEHLRESAAKLINASKGEIAFVKNTSEGISIVANGIDWQWGDRIVTTNVEYPANIYPWMEVVRNRGAKLVMIEEETDEHGRRHVPVEKILAAVADKRTKILTLSHVEYASGQRHDLAKIGAFCREHDTLFCVDAIQSMGVLPIDVRAMHIDYLSADGHKWMLGPEGAGIFFCRNELVERTRPLMIGWMNVVDAMQYGSYDYTLRPDAGRFECGTHNMAGLLGLKAAIDLLASLQTGAVSGRLFELTSYLIDGLHGKGYQVISPRDKWQWSGIVSFTSAAHNHDEVARMLRKDFQIEVAVREGRLRVSPHLYNTEAEIDRLVRHLPGH